MLQYRFKKYLFLYFLGLISVGFFTLFLSSGVSAAVIGVYPSASTVTVGNIISVKVLVSTEGKYINNAEGVLNYPVDLLEPISISKSSSIFNLWVEEPKFNTIGTASFNGGLPTPGYNGSSGEVVTVVFKAKKTGTVSLILADSAIRENDGLGTNILKGYKNASIQIVEAPKSVVKSEASAEIFSINIESIDHRDVLSFSPPSLLSKIDSYLIQIDNNTPFAIKNSDLEVNRYVLPVQNQGDHYITVFAYDKAGNGRKAESKFSSSAIIPPTIDLLPDKITRGESVVIRGKTVYPSSRVDIIIQNNKEKKNYHTQTQNDGTFSFNSDDFNTSGLVYVSAQLVFSENIASPFSETVIIKVEDSVVIKTSKSFIYTLAFMIPAFLLLISLIILVYLGWHKFFGLRRSIENETEDVLRDIHKMMDAFKIELVNQLDKLEKIKEDRDLNKKEEKIFKGLQDSVDSIDDFINKKIKKLLK